MIPVKIDIKDYKERTGKLYVTVTIGKINADVMETGSRDNPGLLPLISAFNYKLQDLITNVKQEDRHLLKYIPDQMLSEKQKAWKNHAIEEDIASVRERAKHVPEGFTINYSTNLDSLNNSDENNVENLKQTIGDQYRLNVGKQMTLPAAEQLAKALVRDVHADYDSAQLAQELKALFDDAARQGKDLDTDAFIDKGTKLIKGVLEQSAEFDKTAYAADDPVRQYLRKTGISLNEIQKGEVKYLYESEANYRRALFGSVLLKQNGIPLDVAWAELNRMNPGLFPSDVTDGDMVHYLYDAAKGLSRSNYYVNQYGFDLDGSAAYEFASKNVLLEGAFRVYFFK